MCLLLSLSHPRDQTHWLHLLNVANVDQVLIFNSPTPTQYQKNPYNTLFLVNNK
jgi:hypothetical protein